MSRPKRPAIIIDGANVAHEGQPATDKPKVSSKRGVRYMVIGGTVELHRPKLKLPDDSTASAAKAEQAVAHASSQAGDATAGVSEG